MNIKWKDGKGNILNADNNKIIYLDVETDKKITINNEEVKKVTIVDGLLNIFRDFNSDLILTIVIPKKNKRDAVNIFNNYDKTGKMLKGRSHNFLLDLVLESSVSNPIFGLSAIGVVLLMLIRFIQVKFGQEALNIVGLIIISYIAYSIIRYIFIKIKRKSLKEHY